MTPRDAAVRHVVDRCPSCGVEHGVPMRECEACDTPLRPWCRVHGREIGWLDGPRCLRCAQEEARRTPRTAAPSLAMPCPAPAVFTTAASPAPASAAGVVPVAEVPADAAKPPRPLRPREHLGVMFLMLLLSTATATLVAVLAAFVYLLSGRGTLSDTPLRFATVGAVVGVGVGILTSVHYGTTAGTPRRGS